MEIVKHISAIPALSEEVIHVWGAKAPEMGDRMRRLEALLSSEEQERAGRFRRDSDRALSIVARGALRVLLGAYLKRAPSELVFGASEHGKPFLTDDASVGFNLSHSGEWVVLAFGRQCRVGVDIERLRPDKDVLGIADRFFAPSELALIEAAEEPQRVFFELWARKEAYVKAHGVGLSYGLNTFAVPIVAGALPERGLLDEWTFWGLEAGSHYASAVVADRLVEHVRCFDFGALWW